VVIPVATLTHVEANENKAYPEIHDEAIVILLDTVVATEQTF